MCDLPKYWRMDSTIPEAHPIISNLPTGWLCPRCERVNAPDVKQCPCQPPTLPNTVSAPKLGPQETK